MPTVTRHHKILLLYHIIDMAMYALK